MKEILSFVIAFLLCGLASSGSAGTRFALTFMQNNQVGTNSASTRLMLDISNPLTAKLAANVKVIALGNIYEQTIQPGQGGTFQLPNEVEIIGTKITNQTVQVMSDQKVLVSAFNYKLYSSDTSLIYPVDDWGTEYYIFTPQLGPSSSFKEFSIVNYDVQNSVEVQLRGAVLFQGSIYPRGGKLTINLGPLESVQIQSQEDLTGSVVKAQQPVAVFTGHSCTWFYASCSHVYEQLLPVSSWGTEFMVVPLNFTIPQFRFDTVQIIASQTTNLIISSQNGATLPTQIQAGKSFYINLFWPNSLHITADNDIQVLYEFNGGTNQNGQTTDPFLINILPNYLLSTSYILDGQTNFTNQGIIIAQLKDLSGLIFDNLPLSQNLQWRQVGGSEYSWAEITYIQGNGFHNVTNLNSTFALYSIGLGIENGYGSSAPGILPAPLNCSSITCPIGEQCQMNGSEPICITALPAMCWAMGDPHYHTFDGFNYNFMGNCTYTMAMNCFVDSQHPAFEIQAKNEQYGSIQATFVATVYIQVYNLNITIVQDETGFVRIDDSLWNLPASLANGKVNLRLSGLSVVLETDFGLLVQYDWNEYLAVTVPGSFMGKVCGLCGNFNGNSNDDLISPNGSLASSVSAFGQSWSVDGVDGDTYCTDGCIGQCLNCQNQTGYENLAGETFCASVTLLTDGPLHDCDSLIDPTVLYENCLFDYCMGKGFKAFLCNIAQTYTDACQRAGTQVYNWQQLIGCPTPQCPANSYFEFSGNPCPPTCENPNPSSNCSGLTSIETCTCNAGYLLSGSMCVLPSQCGCVYSSGGEQRYLQLGESIWADNNCTQKCTCNSSNGQVVCESTSCLAGEECSVIDGLRDCYPTFYATCTISGDPHYNTFDNSTYDFQGTCTYTAAQACHLVGTQLTPFTVVVQNARWDEIQATQDVSMAKVVVVEVYNLTLVLRRNQLQQIMINDVLNNIPTSLLGGKVKVFQEGLHYAITTDLGLKVTYDMVYHVTITVPSSYLNRTCGMCGNFDGSINNEYQLPDGTQTTDINTLGAAWKVPVIGVVCDDGCIGDFCPTCNLQEKIIFEQDCSIITDPEGPFAACQSVIDPDSYYNNCVYDVCVGEGDRNMLCHSIASYMIDCQDFGVAIQNWRTPTFCPLTCPPNSHYQVCAVICGTPCPGLTDIITCNQNTCAEGCACDIGFYFNGTGCIPADQCGCYEDGISYKVGDSMVTEGCNERITCEPSGEVIRENMTCNSSEICLVQNGVRGCYPAQCLIGAGGAITLFSGISGIITTNGAYEMVKVCGNASDAEWFRVVVDVLTCGQTGVSGVAAVYVFFEGGIISVNSSLTTWVNGMTVTLPKQLSNGISVQLSGDTVVIEMLSTFTVSYSMSQVFTLTVSEQMGGMVCGACSQLNVTYVTSNEMEVWRAPDFLLSC